MWGSKNFHLTDNWDRMSDINLPIRDTFKKLYMWAKHLMNVSQVRRNFYLKLKKSHVHSLKKENLDLLIRRSIQKNNASQAWLRT